MVAELGRIYQVSTRVNTLATAWRELLSLGQQWVTWRQGLHALLVPCPPGARAEDEMPQPPVLTPPLDLATLLLCAPTSTLVFPSPQLHL